MTRCSRCVMPSSLPMIALDDEGVCNHCRSYRPVVYRGEAALMELLARSRRAGAKYDCMVNISGGRDSAYALLSLAKDRGMSVLAANYANPFTSMQATENVDRMVRVLGVDFVRFSLKNRIHERILKHNILAWFGNPSAAMVPAICIGCKIIWPDILRIARENEVTCIVNGGNPYEYTAFKKELLGVPAGAGLNLTYRANIGGLFREALANLSYLTPRYLPVTAKGYLFGNQYAIGSRLLGRGVVRADFFHYVPWDENTVLSRIQNELGWRAPAEAESTWRFDCDIAHLKDFMYLRTLGVTERDDFYSKLVREGRMTRPDALGRVQRENCVDLDKVRGVFSALGIGDMDLDKRDRVSRG